MITILFVFLLVPSILIMFVYNSLHVNKVILKNYLHSGYQEVNPNDDQTIELLVKQALSYQAPFYYIFK